MLLSFLLALVLAAPHSLPRQDPREATALGSHEAMARPFQSGGPDITASPSIPPPAKPDSRSAFAQLANGKQPFLDSDREPADFLPEIIAEVPGNSDVVLLLDQTASMGDDIERIREEFEALRKALEAKPGVRFGAVTFSDLKKRGGYGYRAFPLSRDFDAVDGFLKEVMLIGSIEDVHGALMRTMQTFKWRPGAPRLLIVISDEGPALPPDSDYTAADVLAKARSSNPPAQIQPIRIQRD